MRTDASGRTTMSVIDERKLLRACLRDAPGATLAQIVQRHVDLVYAAALRQVRDPNLAEDVTQAVFLVLCRKSGAAQRSKSLAGWLLTVTRYTAVDAMRRQMRQQRHEQAAARPEALEAVEPAESWAGVALVLDEALAKLKTTDRDAVVLRFFQDKPLAEVGRALGIGEEAARKRVARALEKLRSMLSRRGVQIGLAALGTGIAANATQAAPPHLVAAATATALAGELSSSSAAGALAKGALAMMAWARAKVVIAVLAFFAICGGTVAVVMNATRVESPAPGVPAGTRDLPLAAPNVPPAVPGNSGMTGGSNATGSGTAAGLPQSRPAVKRSNPSVGER